jgi:phospholipase D
MKRPILVLFTLLMILLILLTLITGCKDEKNIEVYFCYLDDCAGRLGDEIRQAHESLYFMSYTFTNGRIASEIIIKNKEGVDVKGVIEERNINAKGSKYDLLKFQGIKIKKDTNSALMHHKVFIIDREVVVTGSFNPTEAGNRRNDDNMIIIRDKNVAEEYLEEFNRLFLY